MKAEEYLKQSGYNENWPIRSAQICRLMEGYAQSQLEKEREEILVKYDQWLFGDTNLEQSKATVNSFLISLTEAPKQTK